MTGLSALVTDFLSAWYLDKKVIPVIPEISPVLDSDSLI